MKNTLNRHLLLLMSLMSCVCQLAAQEKQDTLVFDLNVRTALGVGEIAPFLSSANQFDRHSTTPNNLSLWGTAHKYLSKDDLFDYGLGVELDINASPTEQRLFPGELYVEGKLWEFVFTAGRKQSVYGNQDALLSSGGILWSTNSRPIPRLSLESMDYISVPFTSGYIQVKGGLTHGWFTDNTVTKNTLLHYKYAGIRLGGKLPVQINYTFHHAAQWAGTSPVYGTSSATWDNFLRVLMGKEGDSSSPDTEQYNTLGNHIISKNLGLEIQLTKVHFELYWQNIYEDKPIHYMYKSYNQEDGLWGLSVCLPNYKPVNRVLLEFLSTTDQSGPWHDLDGVIYGGQDGYYNNGVYTNGWSYYGMTIGNPWLTSPKYNSGYEEGDVSFENNVVRLYYIAGMGRIGTIDYTARFAYSQNFGTNVSTTYNLVEKDQLSWSLNTEIPCPFIRHTVMTLGWAGDIGDQYGTNQALLLGLRWNGCLTW